MKKILQVLLGIAMVAAAVLSCKKDEIKQETLEVSPSEDLQFLAKGNEDAVLTISASASSYEVDAEDWVITRKNGNKLSVNVEDNKSAERSCDMTISAGTAEPVVITHRLPERQMQFPWPRPHCCSGQAATSRRHWLSPPMWKTGPMLPLSAKMSRKAGLL